MPFETLQPGTRPSVNTNDDPIGGSKVIQSRSPENWIQRALSSLDIIMNTRATDAYVEAEDPGSASDSDYDREEAKQMSEANAGFDYHAKLIVDEQDFKHFTVSDDDKERLLNNAWVEKNSILRKNAIQFLKYNVRHEIGALEAYTTKRGAGEQNGTPISGVVLGRKCCGTKRYFTGHTHIQVHERM